MVLPRILVIDDQYGRCGLGRPFRDDIGDERFRAFVGDRRALCTNFGLLDISGDIRVRPPEDPVAEAVFCPAQVWDAAARRIENSVPQAMDMVRRGWPFPGAERWALVLLDLRFSFGTVNVFGDPEEGSLFGLDALLPALMQEFGTELPVVVLSSTPREEHNARARALGALDFIHRIPGAGAPQGECRRALRDALFVHGLMPDSLDMIIGNAMPVLTMLRSARRASRTARTVLLEGETGTGKGLLARYIHAVSERHAEPFETFNAAQSPSELQADELFGHWRGAFTDARDDRPGLWERADGGTVFIDEVADLDVSVQLRLMQPIEERRVRRLGHPPVGETAERLVDVRVILATNRDLTLQSSIKTDFLNRISAFVIEVPPLRGRREDIPSLAIRLSRELAPSWRGRLLPDALDALKNHAWREGNVREMRNVLERALTNFPDQDITARDLGLTRSGSGVRTSDVMVESSAPAWSQLATVMASDPDQWRRSDVEQWKRELGGVYLDLVAEAVLWSLRVCTDNGRMNLTATARLLSGKEGISTMQAKRLLWRLLTLDGRKGRVWRSVLARVDAPNRELLERLSSTANHKPPAEPGTP